VYWREWDEKINRAGLELAGLALATLEVSGHFSRVGLLIIILWAVLYQHEPYRSEVNERHQKLFSRRMIMTLEEYSELSALEEGRDKRNTVSYVLGSLIFLAIAVTAFVSPFSRY
jgi:dolichol kinase